GAPAAAAPVASPDAVATDAPPQPAPAASGPPPLPAPLRARFLVRHGGTVASPYLYVKASATYNVGNARTPEETRELAWLLEPGLGLQEIMAGQPLVLENVTFSDQAPAGVTYAELPSFISVDGAKGIERVLRDRLDDALTTELLYDRETRTLSHPGESPDDFARRVGRTPVMETKRRNLERKLADKRGDLDQRRQEAKSRGFEKWASLGTSILSNLGIFTGRKRTVTGVGGVLSKHRMENTARSRIERLEADVLELEEELAALDGIDLERFERRNVKPATSAVSLIRYEVVWIS